MSFIPTHEIGLLNAWIFAITLAIFAFLPMILHKKAWKRLIDSSWCGSKEKELGGILSVLNYGIIVYAIFVPLQMGTIWFYAGSVIFVLSITLMTVAFSNYASTSSDEPVTKGLYKISRNPIYVSLILAITGIGIAAASWIIILLVMVYVIITHQLVLAEERHCLETYGEPYHEFKKKVPRYFLFLLKKR